MNNHHHGIFFIGRVVTCILHIIGKVSDMHGIGGVSDLHDIGGVVTCMASVGL